MQALVLSGGGARAAYQVGVIAAIAERAPSVHFPIISGVSAGAINATSLAAHRGTLAAAVAELQGHWRGLEADHVYRVRPTSLTLFSTRRLLMAAIGRSPGPAELPGLLDLTPLRVFLGRAIAFENIDANIVTGRLRALALTATPYSTAATTTFVQGPPDIPMWRRTERISIRASITLDHVMASAAIPILFPAVWLGNDFYADGSVRQTAPLAPSIHLGASHLMVVGMQRTRRPTESHRRHTQYPTAAEGMGLLFSAIFHDALDADAARVERINRLVESLAPRSPAPERLRHINVLHLKPSRDLSSFVPSERRKMPAIMRWIVRAMGGDARRAAMFVSYLLFDPGFTGLLMESGYEDAVAGWSGIERFLESVG